MGKRSRKREPRAATAGAPSPRPASAAARAKRPSRLEQSNLGRRAAERPTAPWHPIPVSEIAIGGGLLLFVLGFVRGADGATLIGAGALLATAGVVELCAREHFAGYRSHVLLLAFLPVVALHTTLALWVWEDFKGPLALAADAVVFTALAAWLLDAFRRKTRRRPA